MFGARCRSVAARRAWRRRYAALDARFAALIFLDVDGLFEFAVKLLNLLAHAAQGVCGMWGILSKIVGGDPICAVSGCRDPEQFYFVVFGKALDLDDLVMLPFVSGPH